MKRKTRLILLLALVTVILSIPLTSYAVSKTVVKNSINLNSSYDLYGNGYHWDASKRTLTLENANIIKSGKGSLFILPKSGHTTIVLKGENHLQGANNYFVLSKDTRSAGSLTIKSNGKGSLYLNGPIIANNCETTVSNCILSIQSEDKYGSFVNNSHGDFTIKNGARVYVNQYFNMGTDLTIDNGYLEVRDADIDINSGLILKNKGEFHCINGDFRQIYTIYTDESTVFEAVTEEDDVMMGIYNLTLLSKKINISADKEAIRFHYISAKDADDFPEIILRNDPKFMYSFTIPYGEYQDGEGGNYKPVLCMKGDEDKVTYTPGYSIYGEYSSEWVPEVITGAVNSITYKSDIAIAEDERIKNGVESTKLTLKSAKTAKGNIALNWTKSPGYRMDYYEVFRSTSKDSGWDSQPIYTTLNEFKTSYTNTKDLKKGQTYYYRVRGVRYVDGEKVYTPLSTKAWRKK